MSRWKVYGPHKGPPWNAQRGSRRIAFIPVQLVGGRSWSLSLLRVVPVAVDPTTPEDGKQ